MIRKMEMPPDMLERDRFELLTDEAWIAMWPEEHPLRPGGAYAGAWEGHRVVVIGPRDPAYRCEGMTMRLTPERIELILPPASTDGRPVPTGGCAVFLPPDERPVGLAADTP